MRVGHPIRMVSSIPGLARAGTFGSIATGAFLIPSVKNKTVTSLAKVKKLSQPVLETPSLLSSAEVNSLERPPRR